ncbi:MAG TPA: TVP38/TMEM64 family protein [Conexibacter sp.]|nr:TVP38/TMEM64 family protein [Conexibacter sp.]
MSPHERRAALRLAALAVAVGALFALVALTGGLSSERVRDALDGAGWVGPLAFILVSSALTVAMFPGPLLAGASGLLFGTAVGAPTAIVAATAGACAAFLLSRHVGARAVHQLSGRRVSALQDWIAARGFLAVLYARILPLTPYNFVNYAAGLTRVPFIAFAGATLIGCAPRAVAYSALGGNLNDLGSPAALAAFGLLSVMALGSVPFVVRDVRRSGSGAGSSSPDARSAAPR